MAKKVLEMKGITKKFPGVIALKDVTFDAEEGEILTLVGENGAGKSTLMKIISGAYPSQSFDGQIYMKGEPIAFTNPRQSEEAGIAMIYQELSMHPELSVAENLFLGYWSKNKWNMINWKKTNEMAKKYMDLVQLDVEPSVALGQLNASQQQLVSIARALAKDPKILVLDEPTSALTKTESENLFKILHQLKQKGLTSILISHKLDEVFGNADRITVLRDGQVIATHAKTEIKPDKIVAQMIGRELTTFYPKETVEIGDCIMKVENYSVPHPTNKAKSIVENVSFDLNKGEIFGICGLVGSGRSELVNSIFGNMEKKAGRLFIDRQEVNIRNPIDAINNGLALVTEDRKHDGIVEVHSIRRNLTLASLKSISKWSVVQRSKETEHCDYYFGKLKIKAPGPETIIKTLSGGNQQKVVLSKWLMTKPRILIVDEPTRGIDVGTKYEIYKIMMDMVKDGISIIMISSEFDEIFSMCDRILVLSEGKQKGIFRTEDCSKDEIMDMMTGAREIEEARS